MEGVREEWCYVEGEGGVVLCGEGEGGVVLCGGGEGGVVLCGG